MKKHDYQWWLAYFTRCGYTIQEARPKARYAASNRLWQVCTTSKMCTTFKIDTLVHTNTFTIMHLGNVYHVYHLFSCY